MEHKLEYYGISGRLISHDKMLREVIKMMINAFGDNRNFRVQLYLFTPVSLFFTGSIFSPEYAFLIVCPFILRKALNITR